MTVVGKNGVTVGTVFGAGIGVFVGCGFGLSIDGMIGDAIGR